MKNKAHTPNPYLQPLEVLVGTWKTIGTHPFLPGIELHGTTIFEWIEGGAFLRMSTAIDHPEFPDGLAIFGSDNVGQETYMLYFDERGISRKHTFQIQDNRWKWWRDDSKFSQRFSVTIEPDGNTMTGKGEMRKEGSDWEGDLDITYHRLK
jgi:hypothetical protein